MKFHCDRCKTKYSIADERVRGKILKIRCKNCSAVITVRESMAGVGAGGSRVAAAPGGSVAGERPRRASSGPAARTRRPSSGSAAGQPSALRGAFQQIISKPPDHGEPSASDSFAAPATLEEEWYVSIDGNQSGPFNLHEARDWVSTHHPDDELYCWSEGFDDWLPTEKVSHFRGLRARPETAPSRAPSVPAAALAAAPIVPASEHTPKPLFAAALAALEKENAADLPEALVVPPPMPVPALPMPSRPSTPAPPVPLPPPMLPTPAPAKTNGSSGVRDGLFAHLGDETDQTEAAPDANPAVDAALEDMDLEIGEVSRVVKLPEIAAMRDAGGAAAMKPAGLPGMGGNTFGKGTGSAAAIRQSQPGLKPLAALSDAAIADAQPAVLTAEKKDDKYLVYIVAGVAALAVTGVVIFMLVTSGGGERRVTNDDFGDDSVEKLGYRFENPNLEPTGDGDDDDVTEPDSDDSSRGSSQTSSRRDTSHTSRTPNTGSNDATKSTEVNTGGRTEVVPDTSGGDLTPLSPIDVTRVASKMTTGRRCYERALKKDAFLKVSKIYVTLTVNTDGVVTSVQLSQMADSFLGQCLVAGIRKWTFRKSSKGITTQISLVFEQR